MAKRGCPSSTYINTLLRDTLQKLGRLSSAVHSWHCHWRLWQCVLLTEFWWYLNRSSYLAIIFTYTKRLVPGISVQAIHVQQYPFPRRRNTLAYVLDYVPVQSSYNRMTVGRLSADCQLTVGCLSANCPPTVGRRIFWRAVLQLNNEYVV